MSAFPLQRLPPDLVGDICDRMSFSQILSYRQTHKHLTSRCQVKYQWYVTRYKWLIKLLDDYGIMDQKTFYYIVNAYDTNNRDILNRLVEHDPDYPPYYLPEEIRTDYDRIAQDIKTELGDSPSVEDMVDFMTEPELHYFTDGSKIYSTEIYYNAYVNRYLVDFYGREDFFRLIGDYMRQAYKSLLYSQDKDHIRQVAYIAHLVKKEYDIDLPSSVNKKLVIDI